MTLSDFSALSTAVSGVAVTISLIYLAIQTRQNTRNTRALIHQGAAGRTTAITIGMMDRDHCAAWIEGNGAAATPEGIRKQQFNLACATAMNAMEDYYLQNADALLNKEQFARNCETFRGLLAEPGFRAYWNERRTASAEIAPRFSAFVDGLCSTEVNAEFAHWA